MGTPSQATAATAAIVFARPALGVSSAPAQADRRASRRYSIDLSTSCEIRDQEGRSVSSSRARVVNISSGGLLLCCEQPLPKSQKIRLRIDWPALLNNVVPLALHVEGQTVRADGNCIGVKILKSEFRTRPVIRTEAAAHSGLGPIR